VEALVSGLCFYNLFHIVRLFLINFGPIEYNILLLLLLLLLFSFGSTAQFRPWPPP
jgi:hypothetical protein